MNFELYSFSNTRMLGCVLSIEYWVIRTGNKLEFLYFVLFEGKYVFRSNTFVDINSSFKYAVSSILSNMREKLGNVNNWEDEFNDMYSPKFMAVSPIVFRDLQLINYCLEAVS